MRDPERIPRILGLVEELWRHYPDQRLGQLLENYVFQHHAIRGSGCIFHIEDSETEARLRHVLEKKD